MRGLDQQHPRAAFVLDSIVALADPATRALFEDDGRPRAVVARGMALLRLNPALLRLLDPCPAPPALLAELFVAEARAAAVQAVEAAMARASIPPSPAALLLAAAAPRPVRLTVAPVAEADGSISGAVLTLEPESDAAADAAQAHRLQAVGALAGGIAHDFNNLLQAIIGAGETLTERLGTERLGSERGSLADEAREEVALILGGARRGATLVRQLLAFSRLQALQPRVVAVNRAVDALAPLLRRSLGERVRLEVVLDEPGRFVHVDPGQLDQVLVNLAVNARDAMPEGGTITLRTGRLTLLAPRAAAAETIPPGRYVAIEVQDTGAGIDPAVLPRIFEPFFTTRTAGGTGLGLATVLGIVRQSGGFVEVESMAGQGSLFRVLLPRSESPPPAPTVTPQAVPDSGRRGLVLLVEDEDAVRRLAQRALERQGWRVLAAESGEAALDLLVPGIEPCCMVTDMVMPGMDGATVVAAVRQRLDRPMLPAVIVSGYTDVPLHDAIGAAATAFLPKPYSLRELAARVAAVAAEPARAE